MKKKELCAVACLFWLAGCSDPASDEIYRPGSNI